MDVWKEIKSRELLEQMEKSGFNARALNKGYQIYKKMLDDKKCVKVLSVAGALIAAGMRPVLVKAIKNGLVDVLVTTGAILTHDLIEAFGVKHIPGDAHADDVELAKQDIDRLYDIYLPNQGYIELEKHLQKIFPKLPQEEMSPNRMISLLGEHIEDENSIIRAAWEKKIPIFCPSITDCILGFQAWMYSQENKLKINTQLDIKDFLDNVVYNNEKYGLIVLGGGTPKNFPMIMMQMSGKSISYAIQITMDRPEHGGLSGANLREGKSWKKITPGGDIVDIICDVTIAFPLLVSALLKE